MAVTKNHFQDRGALQGAIDSDAYTSGDDQLSGRSSGRPAALWHFDPSAGVSWRELTTHVRCYPNCYHDGPQQQNDAKCQSRPNAPQQKTLFDHLVGAGNESRRNVKCERLGGALPPLTECPLRSESGQVGRHRAKSALCQ